MERYRLFKRVVSVFLLLSVIAAIACTPEQVSNIGNLPSFTYTDLGKFIPVKIQGTNRVAQFKAIRLSNGTMAGEWHVGDYSVREAGDIHDELKDTYKTATIVRPATVKYNCHSYAWYTIDPKNKVWFNSPIKFQQNATLKAAQLNGFDKLPSSVKVNHRVVFLADNHWVHSAIVNSLTQKSKQLISKWGPFGLYCHSIKDCPYYFHEYNLGLYYYQK